MSRTSGTGFGRPFTIKGEYRTIEPPHMLAFTWLPDWQQNPTETLVRFDLTEKDGLTTVRLTHSGLTPKACRRIRAGRKFSCGYGVTSSTEKCNALPVLQSSWISVAWRDSCQLHRQQR